MSLFQVSVLNKYLAEQDKALLENQYALFKVYFLDSRIQKNIIASKEEEFQEGFLRELFVKIFGYTINPEPNYNLRTELKNVKDSKKADGAIVDNDRVLGVIELKSTDTTNLSKIEIQAFSYKNNQANCRYVFTSNFQKIRFYIDNAIEYVEWDLFKLDFDGFQLLYLCLSKESIFKNIPAIIKEESISVEENVTKKLYKEYSDFRRTLFNNIVENNPSIDKLLLFKKTQKLLDRFLFLFFAEDRMLVPPNSVRMILEQWTELKEKYDEYQPLYERFKKYFGYLNSGHIGKQHEIFAYNGGLFAKDELLEAISIDDAILYNATLSLSRYDYNSEIDVNILGHIFEHSLTEIEELEQEITSGEYAAAKTTKRKKDGVFYTPKYITKYIVENTVGTLCKGKREALNLQEEDYHALTKKKKKELFRNLEEYRKWLLQITIIDPACGSGAFLNQSLEFLIAEHKWVSELEANIFGSSIVFDVESSILENNLFGVDINEESVDIAKLSLWLRTAKKGRKLNSLNNNIKCGNSLIDDKNIVGDKAFNWEQEFPQIFDKGGFDVVIGNPPYVVYIKSIVGDKIINNIFEKYSYAEYNPNTYALFSELGLKRLLKEGSELGFIIPNTWIDNKYFSKMRDGLYENKVRQIINLKNTAFAEVVETVILIVQKTKDKSSAVTVLSFFNENNTYEEAVPKERLKNASNPFTSKTNSIIDKLDTFTKLAQFAIVYRGLETRDNSKWISTEKSLDTQLPILLGRDVHKYETAYSGSYINFVKKEMKSNANEEFYKKDKILMRRTGNTIIADIDLTASFALKNLYLIIPKGNCKYSILAQLNSRLLAYYHKMKTSGENKAFAQFKGEYIETFPCVFIDDTDEVFFENQIGLLKERLLKLEVQIANVNRIIYRKFDKSIGLTSADLLDPETNLLKEFAKQKIKLSLNEQTEWLAFLEEEKLKGENQKRELDEIMNSIDKKIYELYNLTKEEIEIIQGI